MSAPRPTCCVCQQPIAEAPHYRSGWVRHAICHACKQPVCRECIGDSDGAPDGGMTLCRLCYEARKAAQLDRAAATSGRSRWEVREEWDEREERRERYDQERER